MFLRVYHLRAANVFGVIDTKQTYTHVMPFARAYFLTTFRHAWVPGVHL